MMLNSQKPESLALSDTGTLDVYEIWRTIQGEGPHVGRQATFIRLAGCNLQCPLCDTIYTGAKRQVMKVRDIVQQISIRNYPRLVVITGGEPFRQHLFSLTHQLVNSGYSVQVETNGTLSGNVHPETLIVCSPKTPKVHPDLAQHVKAWKYVMRAGEVDKSDGLPTSVLGLDLSPARPTNRAEIYLQPCDEQDEDKYQKNLDAVLSSCEEFGYRLGVQLHKLVGLP